MRLLRYLWADIVSLLLLLIYIISVIAFFTSGANFTYFLAIAGLNLIYNVNEKGRFIDRLYLLSKHRGYETLLYDLGLPKINKLDNRETTSYYIRLVFQIVTLITAVVILVIELIF